MADSSFGFLLKRRFLPLFNTQFLGAFNDNLIKTSIFVLISYHQMGVSASFQEAQLLNIGAILFILPYFLFSTMAGDLSTKYDKATMAKILKFAEMLIMALAAWGYFTSSLPILFIALFLMGTQSTFFGPLKYAIIPEYLGRKELLYGNSVIETGTFVAILIGQIFGTAMVSWGTYVIAFIIFLVSFLGFVNSMFMPSTGRVDPTLNVEWGVVTPAKRLLAESLQQNGVIKPLIGISWFWFIGVVYTVQLPTWTQQHLGGNEAVFNLMLALFSVGIGVGSIACSKIAKGELKLGSILTGLAGMGLIGIVLAIVTLEHRGGGELLNLAQFAQSGPMAWTVMACVALLGFFGGFYSVPLYTWMQTASTQGFRAKAVALNNIINSLFMIAASLFSALMLGIINNISILFLVTAVLNVVLFVWVFNRRKKILDFKSSMRSTPPVTDNRISLDPRSRVIETAGGKVETVPVDTDDLPADIDEGEAKLREELEEIYEKDADPSKVTKTVDEALEEDFGIDTDLDDTRSQTEPELDDLKKDKANKATLVGQKESDTDVETAKADEPANSEKGGLADESKETKEAKEAKEDASATSESPESPSEGADKGESKEGETDANEAKPKRRRGKGGK